MYKRQVLEEEIVPRKKTMFGQYRATLQMILQVAMIVLIVQKPMVLMHVLPIEERLQLQSMAFQSMVRKTDQEGMQWLLNMELTMKIGSQ